MASCRAGVMQRAALMHRGFTAAQVEAYDDLGEIERGGHRTTTEIGRTNDVSHIDMFEKQVMYIPPGKIRWVEE